MKKNNSNTINHLFRCFAVKTAHVMGSPAIFFLAIFLIIVWAGTGFYFEFSDTWQLIINTGTTIATFLIVILIQNTQNRDSKSLHLKLDELLRGIKTTRNSLVEIEEQSDEEIDELKAEFQKIRKKYMRQQLEKKRRKNP